MNRLAHGVCLALSLIALACPDQLSRRPPECAAHTEEYEYGQCLTRIEQRLERGSPTRRKGVMSDPQVRENEFRGYRALNYRIQNGRETPKPVNAVSGEEFDRLVPPDQPEPVPSASKP
jgi:hypothetical protein